MFEIKGKYNTAKIYANNVDETSISQIYTFLNNPTSKNANIAIMADVHAGKDASLDLL